jgi:hypothetical protein
MGAKTVTNKFEKKNLAQPMRRCSMHPTAAGFFSFGRGLRVFSVICWVSGGCEFSFLFCVMGGFSCYDTLFFWFNLQGACEGPKEVLLHE